MTFPSCSPSQRHTPINTETHAHNDSQTHILYANHKQQHTHTNGDRSTELKSTYFIPGCLSEYVMNTDGSWGYSDRQPDRQLSSCLFVQMFSTLWHVPAAQKIFSEREHSGPSH